MEKENQETERGNIWKINLRASWKYPKMPDPNIVIQGIEEKVLAYLSLFEETRRTKERMGRGSYCDLAYQRKNFLGDLKPEGVTRFRRGGCGLASLFKEETNDEFNYDGFEVTFNESQFGRHLVYDAWKLLDDKNGNIRNVNEAMEDLQRELEVLFREGKNKYVVQITARKQALEDEIIKIEKELGELQGK